MMLTLLLVSMLMVTFNIPPIAAATSTGDFPDNSSAVQEADGDSPSNPTGSQESFLSGGFNWNASPKENPGLCSVDEDGWNFNRTNEWTDFAKVDDDSAELVIGVNNGKPNSCSDILDIISENGGDLVGTVSMEDEIKAIVADIPSVVISSFVVEVQVAGLSRYIEPNMRLRVDLVPNDPNWPAQWGPRRIEADYAWNTTVGDPSVVVAVIDTGVDWDHPDLATSIWNNTDEVLDGADTDGNGFIDDIRGWDFVDTTAAAWPGEDSTVRDNDPMDFHGHGTHCSGIVAAVTNNSIGIAGVCWNCKIMAVRAGYKGEDGYGYLEDDDAAAAIVYATDNGANVISMSWGDYYPSDLIYDAVKYAYDSGVLLVAASGNDDTSSRHFPAAYDEVIAVSATDDYDNPAWFTNFGDWVELAAPGVDIYSTVWDDTYTYMSGTSMSAPHVAGLAALILSQFSSMTRDQLRLQLRFAADDLGDPGFDNYYGYGRINARRAVERTPPDHDLFILGWERPRFVEPGSLAVVNTTVFNFGTSNETNITVELLVNGSIIDSATIDFLETGTSETVNCTWTPMVEGTYNLTFYVLPVPGETLTTNNVVTAMVRVGYFRYVLFDQTHGTDSIIMYNTWVAALTERGYMVDVHTSGSIASGVLVHYDAFVIPQAYYVYTSDELSAIQSFVAAGGGLLVIGDDEPYIYTDLTGFAGITWSWDGCGGDTSDITPHPVTERVITAYFSSPMSSLYVSDPAQGLIRDVCGYIMLAVSETGSGKVLGIADEHSINDYYISYADNFQLAINVINWLTFRPEHDLDVTLDTPPYIEPGESSLLNVTVHNGGLSNETDVDLSLFINGTVVDNVTIPELVIGSSYKLSYLWTPVIEVIYNVTGYVVPVQNETVTENNLAWAYVYVGFAVKAFVLHSAGTYYVDIIKNWEVLNTKWYLFGSQFVYIDYTTLDIVDITYDDIVATGADVLIISCAADPWVGWEFTDLEIEAITRYVREGHGLIATAGTFCYQVPNNNKLASLFGLNETIAWDATYTDLLHLEDPTHPLLINVPNPYVFPQIGTALPPDGQWDLNELEGGSYVALGQYEESAIVVHRGLVYISPWLEIIPSYYYHHLQLLYNAITWSSYQKPEHELVVSLEAPACLEFGESTLLNATVSNFGLNNETDVELFLLVDSATVENATIPELLTGSSYTLSYLWTPTVEAVYNVTAYAPPVPDDEFTANNVDTKIVLVIIVVGHIVFEEAHLPAYTIGSNPAYDVTGGYSEFADYLTASGCTVSTIDPGTIIGSSVLAPVDVLVIVAPQNSYFTSEIDEIETWVEDGGKLLLISDWGSFGVQARTIAARFGINLAGDIIHDTDENVGYTAGPYYDGANLLPHRITASVTRVEMYGGDGISSAPADEIPLIVTDSDGTATWEDGSPAIGVSVMSAFDGGTAGSGRMIVVTDSNVWDSAGDFDGDGDVGFYDSDNEILALNSIYWLAVKYEHDLVVTLEAPAFLVPGDSSLLNATVHNMGLSNETDVELQFLINGSLVDFVVIPELLTDSSYTLNYLWTPTLEGIYNITAYAPHVPGENVTANNWKSKSVEVFCWISVFVTEDNWPIPPDNDLDYFMFNTDPKHPIEWAHWYNLFYPVLKATLRIYAYDVDSPDEVNEVYFNGLYIGQLQGANDQWTLNSFSVPTSYVQSGINIVTVCVDVTHPDTGNWGTTVDWANLIIQYQVLEHDLAVTLEAPTFLGPGDSSLLNATVLNFGLSNETDVALHLLINGTVVNSTIIPKLLTGASYMISYWWTPTVWGTYNITAYAPPAPDETFTENNVATKMAKALPIRDVAIISVTTSATEVYQEQIVNITVVAKNEGNITETFDVATCYDTGFIGIQSVTNLTAGANVTLTFSWDTAEAMPSITSYAITAIATPVPGEADTADNTYVDGTVKVKMVGDVNGDGIVDIVDVTIAAIAFGCAAEDDPGTPWDETAKWNPVADLNGDDFIDIVDLVIIGVNFGERLSEKGFEGTTVYVDPQITTAMVGETFTVNVKIFNVTNLYGYELKLYYDTTLLDGLNVTLPPTHFLRPSDPTKIFVGWLEIDDAYNATHGRVRVLAALLNPEPSKSGSGTLVAITLKATALGSSILDLTDTKLVDTKPELMPHDTIDGYVAIM